MPAPPAFEVGAAASVEVGAGAAAAGAAVHGAVAVVGPLGARLEAQGHLGPQGPTFAALPEVLVATRGPVVTSATVGVALGTGDLLRWTGSFGVGASTPGGFGFHVRARLLVPAQADGSPDAQALVGASWRPGRPPPAPLPPPLPVAAGADLWLPHPVCEHVSVARVPTLAEDLGPAAPVEVAAAGYLPRASTLGEVGGLVLDAAPAQGALLVVASPGDVLVLGEARVAAGTDGVVQLSVPEGFVTGEVTGGGRRATVEAAVASGTAVWVSVPVPGPTQLPFDAGSAVLAPRDRARVDALAALAGGWSFVVEGAATPDEPDDRELAGARVRAVADALIAAGVPAGRVSSRVVDAPEGGAGAGTGGESAPGAVEHDPAALRFARIVPVPAVGR